MMFFKVKKPYGYNRNAYRFDGCVVKKLGEDGMFVKGMDEATGEVLHFWQSHVEPYDGEMTTEELLAQPAYSKDFVFEEGDYLLDEYENVYRVIAHDDYATLMVHRMDENYGTFHIRPDALMKIELNDDTVVGHDYITEEPIFTYNEESTVPLNGFNYYGTATQLGRIYQETADNEHVVRRCDECGQYFYTDDARFDDFWHSDDEIDLCDACFCNYYVICADCGSIVNVDNAHLGDVDEYYCDSCWEDHPHALMHDYGFKPAPVFHQQNGSYDPKIPFMGVELEIDNGNDVHECLEDLAEHNDCEDLFYCKHDGSLNEGIEIVTHPCDLQYHMEQFPWKEITEVAKENGFKSHDTKTCGLHVHVSRDGLGDNQDLQDLNIAKIIILMDRFWDEVVNFSRRNYEALERWAKKPNAKIYSYDDRNTAVEKAKNSSAYDRYKAVNLGNRSTVEFRLFRGTLEPSTILATLQFLSNLVGYVKAASLAEVQETRWGDITGFHEYPELSAYLEKRGLVNVPDKPKPVEPKQVPVRFDCGDVVWFQTENTDDQPRRGVIQSVDIDRDRTLQPLYVVEDVLGHINFLIDDEIFDNDRIAELEAELADAASVEADPVWA